MAEPRNVNLRTGGEARVADCMLKDDSGQIKLSLWDDQIDMVKQGSKVRVTNGYTNSFRGELRLNVGRYGKLEVLESRKVLKHSQAIIRTLWAPADSFLGSLGPG